MTTDVPTVRGTLIVLIGALYDAIEKAKNDPVKYATLKAYQEALVFKLTKTGRE